MLIHKDDEIQKDKKTFACALCENKSFSIVSDLKRHMKVHTGEKHLLAKCVKNPSMRLAV